MPPVCICVAYGDNPVENYAVVVPASRQFSKVFASLVSYEVECDKEGER